MKRLTVILILSTISTQSISQVVTFDEVRVYVFKIEKHAHRQFGETSYWIAQSDTSTFTRLDFREIYDHKEIERCSNGDTLEFPFMTVWESQWLKEGAEIHQFFDDSKHLIQHFTSGGDDVNVYSISMSGQFCKCYFRDFDGEVIGVYKPLKGISIDVQKGINDHKDLSKFEFHFSRASR